MLPGKRGLFISLAYFTAVAAWLTWPLIPRLATGLSGNPDTLLNVWALGWSFHVLPRDPLSLFDANIFAPRPDTLAYSEHLFGITALVSPVYWGTGNLILSYNVAVFASFVLSGLGMFLLTRELTGNGWAALAAGTIFLAAPYRFQHLVQLQLLTYQWFPFFFWCLLRFLHGGKTRYVAGMVVFSLLQILSCNYYAVYLSIAAIVFGLVLLFMERNLLSVTQLAKLAAGALIVFLLALPFILPYQRNRERGFFRRYTDVVHFSASASEYVTPSAFNDAPHLRFLPRSGKALFPGFTAALLAALGLFHRNRRSRVFWVFAVALTVVALILSFGPEARFDDRVVPLPYRFLQLYFPGFSGMRVPARFAALVLVGGSMLAAWGAKLVLERSRNYAPFAAAGILGLLLFEYQTSPLDRILPEPPPIPPVHRWLADAPSPGAVLVLPIHESEQIVQESFYMYYSTVHFKPLVNGYSGWWPNDYWELVGRLRHFPTARILRFLMERAPVRYVVIHYGRIPQPRRRHLEAAMDRYSERMPERFRDGEDAVYEIVR
ncbi:MAG: hypothetical protein ACRD21_07340 [Vicinamibacteria bacterium]